MSTKTEETKHTPGPWEVDRVPAYEEYWVTKDHYNVGPAYLIDRIEDAWLISAAPDLLEACKAVMQVPANEPARVVLLTKQIAAAIAKAEGRQ